MVSGRSLYVYLVKELDIGRLSPVLATVPHADCELWMIANFTMTYEGIVKYIKYIPSVNVF